jgi:hypothetical protein
LVKRVESGSKAGSQSLKLLREGRREKSCGGRGDGVGKESRLAVVENARYALRAPRDGGRKPAVDRGR